MSNDIDIILEKVSDLKNIKETYGLMFITDYNSLFNEVNKVPVVYHLGKVHDFEITNEFLGRAKSITFDNIPIKVSSPEYAILTKLLRAVEKGRLFGKDKLDISSLLLSYESKKIMFDEDFFVYLLNSSPYKETIKNYFVEIPQVNNLNEQEKQMLNKVVYKILKQV